MNSNYVNHNRRMLNEIAGEQHKKWEQEGHRHKLKKAKKMAMPMAGVKFTSLAELKVLV